MRVQNTNLLRARTQMTSNGTRISWMNVNYFDLEEVSVEAEGAGAEGIIIKEHKLGIKWKYKASILTEEIRLPIDVNLPKMMKPFNLVPIGNSYVNVYKIMTINEEAMHGPEERVRVRIVLVDGFELIKILGVDEWAYWKTHHA